MDGFDLASFGRQPQSLGCDLQELCGLTQVKPGLDSIWRGLKHGNAVIGAHRGDAFARPSVAVACLKAVAVEKASDQVIASNEHQLTHCFDDIGGGTVALPAAALGQAHLAMGAARPVNNKDDLGGRVVDIGHDLVDQRANDALFEAGVGRWR